MLKMLQRRNAFKLRIATCILLFLHPTSTAALNDKKSVWGTRPHSKPLAPTSLAPVDGVETPSNDISTIDIVDGALLRKGATGVSRRLLSTRDTTWAPSVPIPSSPRIIIIGGPASGKGTQCEYIAQEFGVIHLSTGDLLREEVASWTSLGQSAKYYMDRGELVPDDIIIQILTVRLEQEDCRSRGWLLDGFPRTRAQAEYLLKVGAQSDITLLLNVDDEALIERVVGRRVDPMTGKSYHLTLRPPPPEIADRLEQRSDDTLDKMRRRLQQYHSNVDEIRSFLEDSLVEVDGTGDPKLVAARISGAIQQRMKQKLNACST